MNDWTNWAIVGSDTTPEVYEEIIRVPGVVHDPKRGNPIFHGSLDDFSRHYNDPFTVHKDGRFINVGGV